MTETTVETPDSVALHHGGRDVIELQVRPATEGAAGVDISRLLARAGLVTYDPGFANTAACSSAITYIDGDAGILRYRGYPIDELAERSSFIEVSYLLIHGELPTADQLAAFTDLVTHHTFVHENVKEFIGGFHHDAHPMGILVGTV